MSTIPENLDGLLPGLPVVLFGQIDEFKDRFHINSGIQLAHQNTYVQDSIVPVNDWRKLSDKEFEYLVHPKSKDAPDTVFLLKFPERITEPFKFVRRAIEKRNVKHVAENVIATIDCRRAIDDFLQYLNEKDTMVNAEFRTQGINLPGVETVGLDPSRGFVGLHYDSYATQKIKNRPAFPSLLVLNVGPEPRYLIFSNQSIGRQLDLGHGTLVDDAIDFQNIYIDKFENYPLVKMRVDPGEAYIAPTQLVLHDASTIDKTCIDVSLAFTGNFRYSTAEVACIA